MTEEGFKRKLTAILSADVEGYSRLMRDDEEATVRDLAAHRVSIAEIVQQHHGRVVDSPGDNILAEFASVVDAVNAAIKIQKEIKKSNIGIPEDRRMEFRIGINLGDVIEEEGRIYGDGVNIAARVEGLATAGDVCISGTVYEHVKDKLSLEYEYLGEQTVKNIPEPIRLYRIPMKSSDVSTEETGELNSPHKPSIAVLPFVNISGDPEQEYFSDGITEDLITDLSQISGLFVIARHSVFTYKGKAVKVQEVGKDLKVRYVLEGSVRKFGDQVRITAQLVDAETGGHLWAERYDRKLKDIFALQDEVTQKVVYALAIKLTKGEEERLTQRYTENLEAYDYTLRGLDYYFRFTKDAHALALKMFEKAIELDPEYALAYSWLGLTHLHRWTHGWNRDPKVRDLAFDLAQRSLDLDDSLSEPHRIMGDIYLYKKQHEKAIDERKKSVSLDPNNADALAGLGEAFIYNGQLEDGITLVEKAIRLNPHHHAYYFFVLGSAFALQRRFDEAEELLRRTLIRNPDFFYAHLPLALIYVETGRLNQASIEIEEALKKNSDLSIAFLKEISPFKDQEINARMEEGLRKAGLK
ncbi:MAG: tetratricopeptide repeat protein [Desulfobacterales bacterium]|jgi:adenylate cyclase|nr:MAG: tetratricopeptide repeat protein [Desulfobacterales bacterium]